MVHQGTDPALAAAQALRWYNEAGCGAAGDSATAISQGACSAAASDGGAPTREAPATARVDLQTPNSGIPPLSLVPGVKCYAFAQVPKDLSRPLASARDGADTAALLPERDGVLGPGVYCWLDANHAMPADHDLFLLRFYPAGQASSSTAAGEEEYYGVKVAREPGMWPEEGFAAYWQPAPLAPYVSDPCGELCLRPSCVVKATRYSQASWFGGADRTAEARRTAWLLAAGVPGTVARLKCKAALVRWPSVGFALIMTALGLLLARFGSLGSSVGAFFVSVFFWMSV